ncbi:hypothetical protein F3J44_02360 [Pantoea sp. Tr-811]|nr:hypothetical protein [Pantoea sp. Tr-811]
MTARCLCRPFASCARSYQDLCKPGRRSCVGAGLPREAGTAMHGTGFAGVRGASPLLQGIAAHLLALLPARQRCPR